MKYYMIIDTEGVVPEEEWIKVFRQIKNDVVGEGSYASATTQHFSSFRVWADIIIYTWEYHIAEGKPNATGIITYQAKITTEERLERIMVHELGHAFGLKHTFYDGNEWSKSWTDTDGVKHGICDQFHASASVMYVGIACRGITSEINKIDYTALIYKYGTDGWNGYENLDFEKLSMLLE